MLLTRADRGAGRTERWAGDHTAARACGTSVLDAQRLALEMAVHEETERRALEGELRVLEAAWRDAEEIAKIADDMFVPESVEAELARLKRERHERTRKRSSLSA